MFICTDGLHEVVGLANRDAIVVQGWLEVFHCHRVLAIFGRLVLLRLGITVTGVDITVAGLAVDQGVIGDV